MRHWGGSGDYVEGERVFAPPHGSFDPDWVAAVVLDREGPAVGDRAALARWAQRAWELRESTGTDADQDTDQDTDEVLDGAAPPDADVLARRLQRAGAPARLSRSVASAVTDVAAAYHLDD